MKFKIGPCIWGAGKDQGKKQTITDREVAGKISKGPYILGLFGVPQTSRSLHLPTRILKVYTVALTGLVTYSVQGCILEMAPSAGTVGGTYIPKTGGCKKPPVALFHLMGQPRSHPLDDHLQPDGWQD